MSSYNFPQLTTLQINEIIVFGSFALLVVSALSCIVMFALRAKKKRSPVDPKEITEISETQPLNPKPAKKNGKKKTKKSKRIGDTASHSSYETGSHVSSETSSLMADSTNDQKAQQHTGTMNRALRSSFTSVLKEGLTLTMHLADQPALQVKMTLTGSELRWRSKKLFSTKSYKLQLRQIAFIEWGKQTATFRLPAAQAARDDTCFSLVAEGGGSFDFETSSKVERDALVQGFMLAVADQKESANNKV